MLIHRIIRACGIDTHLILPTCAATFFHKNSETGSLGSLFFGQKKSKMMCSCIGEGDHLEEWGDG